MHWSVSNFDLVSLKRFLEVLNYIYWRTFLFDRYPSVTSSYTKAIKTSSTESKLDYQKINVTCRVLNQKKSSGLLWLTRFTMCYF